MERLGVLGGLSHDGSSRNEVSSESMRAGSLPVSHSMHREGGSSRSQHKHDEQHYTLSYRLVAQLRDGPMLRAAGVLLAGVASEQHMPQCPQPDSGIWHAIGPYTAISRHGSLLLVCLANSQLVRSARSECELTPEETAVQF